MPSRALDFGVQSWCFRHWKDNATVAQKVKDIGLSKMELCGWHANFEDPKAFKDVVKIYQDAGVEILSLGVQTFTGADSEKVWMECANLAGAKYITAHFKVDSFHTAVPKTAERAEQFGLHIPIHCHGGYMFGGSPDVLDHLMKIGGPRIGLCIDTAWCMQIGPKQGQPIEWAKKYADRLYGLHYKDFTFDRNAQWHDVVVGSGNLDLPNFVKTLNEVHFKGFCVIEYEADIENPVPALSKCVQQMRALAK